MENNGSVYHAIPDTAMSVLELFNTSKKGIEEFSQKIIEDVVEGRVDPLKVKVLCKTLEQISERINDATKDHQKNEASKYGDKPFMFMGAEIHLTSVKTEYDFSNSGDVALSNLLKVKDDTDKKIKDRQEFIKNIPPGGIESFDDASGEIIRILPPVKKQTTGIKISIK